MSQQPDNTLIILDNSNINSKEISKYFIYCQGIAQIIKVFKRMTSYFCEVCDKDFASADSLRNHKSVHSM